GRILDELDVRGDRDNTLVIYTSDHGHLNGHHGLCGKGNFTVPVNFLEESIKVPCLLSWPTGLPAGKTLNALVDHCDLFHTTLDATGTRLDRESLDRINSPGSSYLSLL